MNELRVTPMFCILSTLPQVYNIRAEGWIYDSNLKVKVPHNFIEFRIVIASTSSCRGSGLSVTT